VTSTEPTPDPAVSVSPVDTELRERIVETLKTCHMHPEWPNAHHDEHIRDGACYLCRGDVEKLADALLPVFEQAHGDLVVRNTLLRDEDRQHRVALAESISAATDLPWAALLVETRRVSDEWLRMARQARAELASRSTPPQDAGLPDATQVETLARWLFRMNGRQASESLYGDGAATPERQEKRWNTWLTEIDRDRLREIARTVLADLKAAPATDPVPATPAAAVVFPGCIDGRHVLPPHTLGQRFFQCYCGTLRYAITEPTSSVAPQAPAASTAPKLSEIAEFITASTEPDMSTPPAVPDVPEDTATRPWTAHEVTVVHTEHGSSAYCLGCPGYRASTERSEVEDWVDSHRADTTRPSTSTPKEA
jgi:hypothetical protein